MDSDRAALWLPLLDSLTARFPDWAVWKNVESAMAGTGDIDSFAPPSDWPAIEQVFRDWARGAGLSPVIVCRHVPQGPHFIALQSGSDYIVQLDVKVRGTFRGSTLIDAWSLQPLTEIDERGFRRVRPGTEGVIKLCMNGTRRGGQPNQDGLRAKRVLELLAADPTGVLRAADLFGPARDALLRGATAVLGGAWDAHAMRTVEAWFAFKGVLEPGVSTSRLWFLHVAARRCPIITLIREHDRKVPEDRAAWLRRVKETHEVTA